MEACIEALFKIEGENGRRKTIEMIRVLKGAISVSKSRTGEVIYHYNRHEKKALRRLMSKYDRDTRRSKLEIEHQKRDILRKWSLVFGKQRNFCESIKGFDDMIAEAIVLRDKFKDLRDTSNEEEDEEEPEITEEEKMRLDEEERKKAAPQIVDPRKRRLPSQQPNPAPVSTDSPSATTTGILPKINMNAGLLFTKRETEEEMRARLEREAAEERKRKAKELPRFDRELVKDFLKEQKHVHEDLLTRNALMKIKSQVDHDHVFFKYRMKTKLPGSAQTLLQQLENDRPVEVDSRCLTRQSTRSDAGPRPNTRTGLEGSQQAQPSGVQTARPTTRSSVRTLTRLPTRQSQRSHRSLSRSDPAPSVTSEQERPKEISTRLTHTADKTPLTKLERSKTVHFS